MSDFAISISNLYKSFRRYSHPGWRAFGALGIPVPLSRYDIFPVLKNINIKIKRGEKVALIGRNGAGKSTLLRLLSGQMRPDSGAVTVNGQVKALMEMGTGFHPDFTGLENIRSALSFHSMSQRQVTDCIEEIADFTELDDFLNRPVKEYSSGMYARLAFAVATCITPEILIIDEVLGAGDAYFMGKSIQRMKALTSQGATILFVSHDMGSVQLLCERGIWLDQGEVREDGLLLPVSKAYLASIRDEEERRVKARSMLLTKKQANQFFDPVNATSLLRLIGIAGRPPKAPTAVASIRFGDINGLLGELLPGITDGNSGGPIIDPEHMNWKSGQLLARKPCWLFADYGGRYQHAPFKIVWPLGQHDDPWIEIVYINTGDKIVQLDMFDPDTKSYTACAFLAPSPKNEWQTLFLNLRSFTEKLNPVEKLIKDLTLLAPEDRYGSGEACLTGFGFFDSLGTQRHTLTTGESAFALLSYKTSQPVRGAVPVIAIYKPDGTCAMQLISSLNGQSFTQLKDNGCIRVDMDPLHLGPGDYLVSVALFKDINLASSKEPDAYDLHDRCYALRVLPPIGVQVEIGTVNQPAVWKIL